jgi:hypothetical protein
MRQSSPTGAALGNPSNAEGQQLRSKFGSLDATASPAIFNRNVNRAIESYLDVIHGTPEQRDKLVEEGKITEQQNAQIEALYPSSTNSRDKQEVLETLLLTKSSKGIISKSSNGRSIQSWSV